MSTPKPSAQIRRLGLDKTAIDVWSQTDPRYRNWPVVYVLDGEKSVYIGESLNVAGRFRQHIENSNKKQLKTAHVVIDETFNKSVCLDLESWLIQLFAGDGALTVLNRNEGVTDTNYFDRTTYQSRFDEVFTELKTAGMFTKSIGAIKNSNLYKLSPFKALTEDQRVSVSEILDSLFDDLDTGGTSRTVIQGDPGTGKTIVAIYLMKLLADIKSSNEDDEPQDEMSLFSDFFTSGYREQLADFEFGFVIPQQALRKSVKNVFKKVPGLHPDMVLDPFGVGASDKRFDLLIVDEAHRLSQRASQASGVQNKKYTTINQLLFGDDAPSHTQLDWIDAQSAHQILLVDAKQSVRPGDLPRAVVESVVAKASSDKRFFTLKTQHRVQAGDDYVGYVRAVFAGDAPPPRSFPGYDLQFFDDIGEMEATVRAQNTTIGLARMVAGYAWPWRSKTDSNAFDINIDGHQYVWNRTLVDWIASPTSINEVGSIHTTQGYDLNIAGVIIGKDLRYDTAAGRLRFDRSNYFDTRGKANNKQRGITYSDDDILEYVENIYAVLMTRGIRGTYVYVCDPDLREYLRRYYG